jgi:hypothetical protein
MSLVMHVWRLLSRESKRSLPTGLTTVYLRVFHFQCTYPRARLVVYRGIHDESMTMVLPVCDLSVIINQFVGVAELRFEAVASIKALVSS